MTSANDLERERNPLLPNHLPRQPPAAAPLQWAVAAIPAFRSSTSLVERLTQRAATMVMVLVTSVALVVLIVSLTVPIHQVVRAQGMLEPVGRWQVRAPERAEVQRVFVHTGDVVLRGQTLALLATPELDDRAEKTRQNSEGFAVAEVRARTSATSEQVARVRRTALARAALLAARSGVLDRMVTFGLGANTDSALSIYRPGSHIEVDRSIAVYREASAELLAALADSGAPSAFVADSLGAALGHAAMQRELKMLNTRTKRLRLVSPTAGIVVTTMVEQTVGRVVQAGESLVEVADTSAWRLTLSIGERDIARVKVGDSVRLSFSAIPSLRYRAVTGVVQRVGATPVPSTPESSGGYSVEVALSRGEIASTAGMIRPGYSVEARIQVRSVLLMQLAFERITP